MAKNIIATLVIENIRDISPEQLVRGATGKVCLFVLYMHDDHNDSYLTSSDG